MIAILKTLKTGAFLTGERLELLPAAFLLGYALALFAMAATAHGISDYQGRPLGTDFSNVYAAGKYVLAGDARAPFDPALQYREEQNIFGPATPFYGWHYPPYFLLVAAPLARFPYLWALAAWQLGTLALYLAALFHLLRASDAPDEAYRGSFILLAVAFPAAFVNLTHGNNGFMTAALMAAGLAALERRPWLAGVLFGLLAYKPQFAIMIPVALAAGGYWRTIVAGALTVAALSLAVTLAFGWEVWNAFFASTHFARMVVLEQGNTGFNKIQSVFAWSRLWGGPIPLAYVLQGLTTIAAAAAVFLAWKKDATRADRGALLCLAALIATPYLLDYDLVALAPVIALLGAQGLARGFRPYEKTLLALLWIVPIVARELAGAAMIPLGPMTLLAATAFLSWQGLREPRNYLHHTASA